MGTKYFILMLFLLILAFISYLSYKRINTYEDYNLAGKRTGLFALTATLVAAEFNTATLIGGASVAYLFGTVGIWYTSLIFLVVFLVYALTVSKKYRRLNISTIPEFFDKRFKKQKRSEPMRIVSTIITLIYTWFAPAAYVAGISVIGNVLLGVNPITFAVTIVLLCLVLAITGGLITAIGIDVVAFIMFMIGVPAILFIGIEAAGGFANLSQVYEPKFLSLKPVWDSEVNFLTAMTWGLQVTFLYIAAPWYGQRIFSAKSDNVAYKAMLINTVIIVFLYAIVTVATMLSKVAMPNLSEPEKALPLLIANYSPPLVQGLLLVTLLLVGTSTIVAVWNSSVSIVINDLVKRYLAKNKSERYYINASRIGLVVIAITTIIFGILFVGQIQSSLLYLSVFGSMIAIPILTSLYWRRYNATAALASVFSSILYCTIALVYGLPAHFVSPIGALIATVVGVLVTLMTTSNEDVENSREFFEVANSESVNHEGLSKEAVN